MAQVTGWNNIQVIHHGQLTVVTGTVGTVMHTNKTRDFDREKLVFVVPADNQGNPLPIDQPGPVSVIVYPATYENRGGNRCKNMLLSEHYARWSTYFLSCDVESTASRFLGRDVRNDVECDQPA